MTVKEKTFSRWHPLSLWCKEKLPDSKTGFWVNDIDYIIYDQKFKKLMILEIKTRNYQPANWQKQMLNNLHKWLTKGMDIDWKYLGIHLIVFENTNFSDGAVYFDNQLITEQDLINKLSLGRCEKQTATVRQNWNEKGEWINNNPPNTTEDVEKFINSIKI